MRARPLIDPAAIAALADFLQNAPEVISLDDVKSHPTLAHFAVLADDMTTRIDYRALEWCKMRVHVIDKASPALRAANAAIAMAADRRALILAYDTLRDHMRETFGPDESAWRDTVFWAAYEALRDTIA